MLIQKLVNRHRAIGWHQTTEMQKKQASDTRKMQQKMNRKMMKIGIKHNKVKQTHFRLQYQNAG